MTKLIAPAVAACLVVLAPGGAVSDQDAKAGGEPGPEFTEAILSDPARQDAGREIWQEQCRHCHGRSAYPGKAPKLRPRRYTADFVYDRVTNGFRKMPAWGEVYSQEERIGLVAYVLSKDFSP